MRDDIVILAEIDNILPRLEDNEYQRLKESIISEGVREPIILWIPPESTGLVGHVLIDGHNRWRICSELGITPPMVYRDFPDIRDATAWVINNQLARRNLSVADKNYLIGKASLSTGETNEELADRVGVSPRTVYYDKKFAEAVDGIASNTGKPTSKILHEHNRKEIIDLYNQPVEKQKEVIESENKIKVHPSRTPLELARRIMHRMIDCSDELSALADKSAMIADMRKEIDNIRVVVSDFADELNENQYTTCPKCNGNGCDYCFGVGLIPVLALVEAKKNKHKKDLGNQDG